MKRFAELNSSEQEKAVRYFFNGLCVQASEHISNMGEHVQERYRQRMDAQADLLREAQSVVTFADLDVMPVRAVTTDPLLREEFLLLARKLADNAYYLEQDERSVELKTLRQ